MEIQRRRYFELSLKTCTNSVWRKNRSENENARDVMPEPVMINLDSDDDDSLTGTASENENEISFNEIVKLIYHMTSLLFSG